MGSMKEAYQDKIEAMEIEKIVTWFHERFEDPVHQMPYDSKEGGYIFITGGPYDAHEVLEEEFGGTVQPDLIDEAVGELEDDCVEWATIENRYQQQFEWEDFLAESSSTFFEHEKPHQIFRASVTNLRAMIGDIGAGGSQGFLRLFYANAIAIFEAYVFDKFVHKIFSDNEAKKKLLANHPTLKTTTLNLSEIVENVECVNDVIRSYLHNLVWHRLKDVNKLYGTAFNIGIKEDKPWFNNAKDIRNHIVHRNGKDLEGEPITITMHELDRLIENITNVVDYIEERFRLYELDLVADSSLKGSPTT